jgi:hypothetical protein
VCAASHGRKIPVASEADDALPHNRPPDVASERSIVTPQNSPTLHPCSPRPQGFSYNMSGADTAVNHSPLDASAFVAPRNLLARPALPAADKEQIESLVRTPPSAECAR